MTEVSQFLLVKVEALHQNLCVWGVTGRWLRLLPSSVSLGAALRSSERHYLLKQPEIGMLILENLGKGLEAYMEYSMGSGQKSEESENK